MMNTAISPHKDAFALLEEIRSTKRLYGEDGSEIQYAGSLVPPDGLALYNLVRQVQPNNVLEVGMEYADSTLHLLQGIRDNGKGTVLSIDPFQRQYARGGGLKTIERANLQDLHKWIEAKSEFALPQLLTSQFRCELAFVDGNHLFDQTMVELFFIDKMLPVGGVIALHDYWMASIKSCSNWLETNRMYRIIPFESTDLRILQKTKEDERTWNFFKRFDVPQESEYEGNAKF